MIVFKNVLLKEIPGFPNYYAGNDGQIYSRNYKKNHIPKLPRLLKYGRQKNGYRVVNISYGISKTKTQRVHVLICMTFNGPRPDGMQCSHLNDDKENNRPENLIWESDSDNKKRKYFNNGGDRGVKNSRAIFTPEDVFKVRSLLKTGMTHQKIADEMNCSRTSISRIYNNRRYSEVA